MDFRHGPFGGRSQLRASQAGLSVIEFLAAMTIAAALVGIAIPTYSEFKERAVGVSAQASLRAAVPAIELYFVDNGTYAGISHEELSENYAAELAPLTFTGADATTYCVQATAGDETYSQNGPGQAIVPGSCADAGTGDGESDPSETGG